jgi:heme/copper-type cytochrome/quinol oxidase subunit 3
MSGLTPIELNQQRKRSVKLITYLSIAAIVIMFAGLISAVFVSYKDKFWVNLQLPQAFMYSTFVVVLSSLLLFFSLKWARKNAKGKVVGGVLGSLVLGIAFVVLQFIGFKQMIESGNVFTGNIFYQHGAYGDKFAVLKNGTQIYYDGYHYTIDGQPLNATEIVELKSFLQSISGDDYRYKAKEYTLQNYGSPYSIVFTTDKFNPKPLTYSNGKFSVDSRELIDVELSALFYFAFGVTRDMPFFMVKGEYGKNFSISLNGEQLEFENRRLFFPEFILSDAERSAIDAGFYDNGKDYKVKHGKITQDGKEIDYKGFVARFSLPGGIDIKVDNGKWIQMRQELTPGQYNEFYQARNNASSFLYVLTTLHALHIVLGLLILAIVAFRAKKGYYNSTNTNGLESGSIFWHFLGILWISLYLFWITITL